MATEVRRYVARGMGVAAFDGQLPPGSSASVGLARPQTYVDVTIDQGSSGVSLAQIAADADVAAVAAGYEFTEASPPTDGATMIAQIQSAKLSGSPSTISVLTFTDVLTVTLSTKGGSKIAMVASACADVSLGASVRLLLNGGSFTNKVFGPAAFPILTGGTASFTTFEDIPVTGGYTTYTIKMQMAAVTLGNVTPRVDTTTLGVFEYR